MTYNSKIYHEQGGSVLVVGSGGSLNIEAGGEIDVAGDLKVTGTTSVPSTGNLAVAAGGSITIDGDGVLTIGSAQIMWAASTTGPAGGPVNALPGSIFIRSDGSVTGLYVNVGVNGAGSVWASACLNQP
jgi:hypothetical protein